jgi:flagellar L-ring protein precursor FlgH
MRLTLALLLPLAGCAVDARDIGREPHMTPVGSGLYANADLPPDMLVSTARARATGSLWDDRQADLFRDPRATKAGDVVTVNISMNDKATLGNSTDRSIDSKITNSFDAAIATPFLTGKTSGDANVATGSSTQGQGTIDRSEKIQLSVAAVVTGVLPNGNLFISGSQEMRVNFELRLLTVSGIVRPRDIGRDNTISYDKIAEARIAYGGRGRLTEVQQPALVHQVYDLVKPF